MDSAHAAALPTRELCGRNLLPLSTAGKIDQRGKKEGGFSAPGDPCPGLTVQSGECRPQCAVRAVNWELCT